MKTEFVIGDVVIMKSGSPPLTIVGVYMDNVSAWALRSPDDSPESKLEVKMAQCRWFHQGGTEHVSIPMDALTTPESKAD